MNPMQWKTMQEWKVSGPENGREMLLLLPSCDRVVGTFSGMSQCWFSGGSTLRDAPVAWAELPPIPMALVERIKAASELEKRADSLRKSPLEHV